MLQLFGSGLISLWLDMTGLHVKPLDALELLALPSRPGLVLALIQTQLGRLWCSSRSDWKPWE